MDEAIRTHLAGIRSGDRAVQGEAYHALIEATETQVDWADEAWDELVESLTQKDNRLRSIASQLLCNLARSDTRGRILDDFDALLEVTRDTQFVTARHCLLALWKIGVVGDRQRRMVVDGLSRRFEGCSGEKNCTLIRFDIVQGLRRLYDEVHDESIRETASRLIESEPDSKYRKKYASVWAK